MAVNLTAYPEATPTTGPGDVKLINDPKPVGGRTQYGNLVTVEPVSDPNMRLVDSGQPVVIQYRDTPTTPGVIPSRALPAPPSDPGGPEVQPTVALPPAPPTIQPAPQTAGFDPKVLLIAGGAFVLFSILKGAK